MKKQLQNLQMEWQIRKRSGMLCKCIDKNPKSCQLRKQNGKGSPKMNRKTNKICLFVNVPSKVTKLANQQIKVKGQKYKMKELQNKVIKLRSLQADIQCTIER